MADGGPLYKRPEMVKPHDAVYVSTDPVAMDAIGWEVVEKLRAELNLKTLTEAGREPAYIKAAGDLGLGVSDRSTLAKSIDHVSWYSRSYGRAVTRSSRAR